MAWAYSYSTTLEAQSYGMYWGKHANLQALLHLQSSLAQNLGPAIAPSSLYLKCGYNTEPVGWPTTIAGLRMLYKVY